jgi:hypothetical protein
VGIIDGTGPREDVGAFTTPRNPSTAKYDHVMSPGFCKQLEAQLGLYASKVLYQRGPGNSGAGLADAVSKIATDALRPAGQDIVLIGYSRGALGVVQVCNRIRKQAPRQRVLAVLLFDPVDRYASLSLRNDIPANVHFSCRAYRVLDPSIYKKYDGSMQDVDIKFISSIEMANPFRPGFGRTAKGVERSDTYIAANHVSHPYVGSHGAMGGVGYNWVLEDQDCQANLCRDVNKWFEKILGWTIALAPGLDPDIGVQSQSPCLNGKPRVSE